MPNLTTAYNWAIQWCNEPDVLYSMTGLRNQYRYGRDSSGYMYFDCSSFIWFCLQSGGWDVIAADPWFNPNAYNAITTHNMPTWLTNLGWYEADINGTWLAGDIVWRPYDFLYQGSVGHTEMVYSGGSAQGITMGAHSDASDGYAPEDQVSINPWYTGADRYQKIYRYGSTPPEPPGPGPGPTPGKIKKMPFILLRRIYPWL